MSAGGMRDSSRPRTSIVQMLFLRPLDQCARPD